MSRPVVIHRGGRGALLAGRSPRQAGFSLIEVMVALVVCSIGLLGLAKMESLALSSEDLSGNRTIAAIEASSLAAMMHADRGYWATSAATALAGSPPTWTRALSPCSVARSSDSKIGLRMSAILGLAFSAASRMIGVGR